MGIEDVSTSMSDQYYHVQLRRGDVSFRTSLSSLQRYTNVCSGPVDLDKCLYTYSLITEMENELLYCARLQMRQTWASSRVRRLRP